MPIIKQKEWNKHVELNKDPYGKCCVDVAREVMRMIDEPIHIHTPIDTHRIICDAVKNVGEAGITGFMAECIVNMVSRVHSRGKDLRKS